MQPLTRNLTALSVLMAVGGTAQAQSVNIPHTFQAGDPAVAAEVNANFAPMTEALEILEGALDTTLSRIDELKAELGMTEAELEGVPASLLAFSMLTEGWPSGQTPGLCDMQDVRGLH